jgi:hypothetical protein
MYDGKELKNRLRNNGIRCSTRHLRRRQGKARLNQGQGQAIPFHSNGCGRRKLQPFQPAGHYWERNVYHEETRMLGRRLITVAPTASDHGDHPVLGRYSSGIVYLLDLQCDDWMQRGDPTFEMFPGGTTGRHQSPCSPCRNWTLRISSLFVDPVSAAVAETDGGS